MDADVMYRTLAQLKYNWCSRYFRFFNILFSLFDFGAGLEHVSCN